MKSKNIPFRSTFLYTECDEGLSKGPPAEQVDCLFMVEGDQGLIAERYTSVSVEATDLQERLTDCYGKCGLIGVGLSRKYGSLQILGAYRPIPFLVDGCQKQLSSLQKGSYIYINLSMNRQSG